MKALAEGTISPITPAQSHFVDVFKNNLAPKTQYEKIFKKYLSRKAWEIKYGDTSDTPQKIIPRHWEGLTVSSDARFKTYQL
ncbi:MAG: DUF413 domain-containing protein [Desulfovibrio sp.]|nr:DUF413 domain-containing protein [Desulfovibrio sp.]